MALIVLRIEGLVEPRRRWRQAPTCLAASGALCSALRASDVVVFAGGTPSRCCWPDRRADYGERVGRQAGAVTTQPFATGRERRRRARWPGRVPEHGDRAEDLLRRALGRPYGGHGPVTGAQLIRAVVASNDEG
jgi:hypothetical protein